MTQPLTVPTKLPPRSDLAEPRPRPALDEALRRGDKTRLDRAERHWPNPKTPIKSRRAVVIIWSLTHLKELARLVRFLQQETHWQPVVLLGYSVSATPEAKQEWNAARIPWYVFGSLAQNPQRVSRWRTLALSVCNCLGLLIQLALLWPLVFTKNRLRMAAIYVGRQHLSLARFVRPLGKLCSTLGRIGLKACVRATPRRLRDHVRRRWQPVFTWLLPHTRGGFRLLRTTLNWALKKTFTRPRNTARRLVRAWATTALSSLATSLGFVGNWLAYASGYNWLMEQKKRFQLQLVQMRDTLRIAGGTFGHLKPDVIVLAEDNVSYPTGLFIKAARQCGAASVVIPYTLASTKEFVEGFRDDPECSTRHWHNWLVARLFPKWRCSDQEREFLRLPAYQALAMEWLGIAPAHPWIPNDGHWTAFAVESRRMRERYLTDFGMPAERLALTGAMSDDTLHAAQRHAVHLKKEVYRELGLAPGRPLVLVAFPPNQFSRKHPDLEFTDYRDMTRFLVKSLQSLQDFHVVFSLHPRIDPETKAYIESLGAIICYRDTLEMVPICDVYVASVSATIRWAIACGLPVINYDIFHYCYDDYDGAPGVISVRMKKDWLVLLDDMDRDPAWITNYLALQQSAAADWGETDGKSGTRMVELFDKVSPRTA